ncbi:MAG: pantetheine-phosphate adenylyltransferase [Deltaproteobacteria bacterium CG11_big_fil_rev_8_21_14_0_20_47_16]|nr:MAG: pantetheine-phosphate adenylyltransferase [Deltaproteobacteria bacterium CG11_big_fil_rev_8_21_14_0_20_47_16]
MKNTVIYPGSFDPPTNGHINIVERSLKIFDRVIVAVAEHSTKVPIFSPAERVEMMQTIFSTHKNVIIEPFSGLLMTYARQKGVQKILRGIRNVGDYEFESQMMLVNRALDPELDTIFMMTEGRFSHISSSIIREIVTLGGSITGMVHPVVEQKLKSKLTP